MYVTGVVPTGKKDPGWLVTDTNEGLPELSVTVGLGHVTWAMFASALLMVTVMSSSC